jgi:hypothetical protein
LVRILWARDNKKKKISISQKAPLYAGSRAGLVDIQASMLVMSYSCPAVNNAYNNQYDDVLHISK